MRVIVRQLDLAALRLKDRVRPPVRLLFVGINPGVHSALTGHHFAGYSNRFWKLLFEAGLVPERLTADDDHRLPEWGLGITNLVARPSPGIDTLRPEEFRAGVARLRRKVRRWRPRTVAMVGVTVYRAVCSVPAGAVPLGPQRDRFEGARVFVLPNPSGRNANYSYMEMLSAFKALAREAERQRQFGRRAGVGPSESERSRRESALRAAAPASDDPGMGREFGGLHGQAAAESLRSKPPRQRQFGRRAGVGPREK